jgi:hypothetical protein
MATTTVEVLTALRNTARNLSKTTHYQWGHMGSCNCGFLAQEISHLRKDEIHARAMQKSGDWCEQLNDYCPSSGLLMDNLISNMLTFGFDSADLKHLERLSDPEILRAFPTTNRNLKHHVKHDVIQYLNAWADLIEQSILARITLRALQNQHMVLQK